MAADDHALVIGINEYGAGIRPLEACHNDARRFEQWLVSNDGGQVPAANVTCILSRTDAAGRRLPDFTEIEDAVYSLFTGFTTRRQRGRRLYLYFAGHGLQPKDLQTGEIDCLVLVANATKGLLGRNVHARETAELFRKTAFEEVVLFVDCCLEQADGSVARNAFAFIDQVTTLIQAAGGTFGKLAYGIATTEHGLAFETDLQVPGEPAALKRGRFTFSLLEGLRCALDPETAGAVTIKSLAGYTSSMMAVQGGPSQVPQFSPGHFVLCRPPIPSTTVVVKLRDPGRGVEVRRNAFEPYPAAPVVMAPDLVRFQLPPGLYELRQPAAAGVPSLSLALEVREEALHVTF